MTGRSDVVVGADVGGTSVEAVVADSEDHVLGRARTPTDPASGEGVLASAALAIAQAIAACDAQAAVSAIGVGVPGHVDGSSGDIRLALNLTIDELGLPIGRLLEDKFGLPTVVENDARVGALGAFHHLAREHEGMGTLAYLSIGTGLSAGLVIDGRVHRGRDGSVGEIGHVVVEEDGPLCRCGLRGCLEAVAAGPAIRRQWAAADGDGSVEALFRAAAAHEPAAERLARSLAGHLTTAVSWLATVSGPDLVVLGGGVGANGPLLAAIRDRLRDRAERSEVARRTVPPERVVAMPAGHPTGALGAASLARSMAGRGPGGGEEKEGTT
jgi:glucokinase